MRAQSSRRLGWLVAIIMAGCILTSISMAAAARNELSLPELVRRLLGVEQRVTRIEERLDALEKADTKPGRTPQKKPVIEIISPKDGDEVGRNVIVTGVVHVDDLAGRFPVVGVRPMLTNATWIQALPIRAERAAEGYRFRTRAFCGTAKQGIGEQFELYALLPRKGALNEGDQLDRLPADVPVSASVLVRRTRN